MPGQRPPARSARQAAEAAGTAENPDDRAIVAGGAAEDPDNHETEAAALARLYDVDLIEDPGDLDLYRALAARTGGPIVELGVGSGRLAVPLAAEGYDVVGVDRDPAMLARARTRAATADAESRKGRSRGTVTDRKDGGKGGKDSGTGGAKGVALRLALRLASIEGLDLPESGSFRLAILALNSIMLLGDRAAQAAAVAVMASHLAPGGLAVVDAWLPDADDLARYDGRVILEYVRPDPETGRVVVKTGSAIHDAATQTVSLTSVFDEGVPGGPVARWTRHDRLRLVGADELRAFAESAGLSVEVIAGGYDLEPLAPGADRAILVARRSPGLDAPDGLV